MKKLLTVLLSIVMVFPAIFLPSVSYADCAIGDVGAHTADSNVTLTQWLAVSFVAPCTGQISTFTFVAGNEADTATFGSVFELNGDNATNPDNVSQGQTSTFWAGETTPSTNFTATTTTAFQVINGTRYWFVLKGIGSGTGSIFWDNKAAGTVSAHYTTNSGSTWNDLGSQQRWSASIASSSVAAAPAPTQICVNNICFYQ